MDIQQYKVSCEEAEHAVIGAFVFFNEDSNTVCGFVSDTDQDTWLEITLFDPTPASELPPDIFSTNAEVDWTQVFEDISDAIPDKVKQMWTDALSNTPTTLH